MKIRPKTFECALELVKQGYVLYVDDSYRRIMSVCDHEIEWEEWWDYHWTAMNNDAWQRFDDWYFKKGK